MWFEESTDVVEGPVVVKEVLEPVAWLLAEEALELRI